MDGRKASSRELEHVNWYLRGGEFSFAGAKREFGRGLTDRREAGFSDGDDGRGELDLEHLFLSLDLIAKCLTVQQ